MIKQKQILSVSSIIIIGLLQLLQGCTYSKNEIIHPDFDRLPPDSTVDYSVDLSQTNNEPLPYFFHPDSLRLISTIGDKASFGDVSYYDNITEIERDNRGNLYFSKHQKETKTIDAYDKKGEYLYTLGGEGKGPGEFLRLISYAFDSTYQTLYALDFFEIEIFTYQESRFEYKTTVPHGLRRVFDICTLGKDLFISGHKIASVDTAEYENKTQRTVRATVVPPITRFDLATLEPEISFGFEYKTEYGYGAYEGFLSRMLLSCNASSQTVVGYQMDFPFIFGYDREGRQKWISRTDGIITAQHTEFKSPQYKNAGLMHYTNEVGFHDKYPMATIDLNEFELLQLVKGGPPQTLATFDPSLVVRDLHFQSVLVNSATGQLFYSDAYGRVGLVKGNIVITVERDPDTFQRTFFISAYQK